jgi:hypothetical protein
LQRCIFVSFFSPEILVWGCKASSFYFDFSKKPSGFKSSRIQGMQTRREGDLKVFVSHRESVCGECEEELGSKAWIMLSEDKGALCLSCADLDHLLFLPSGDMALSLRARKYSRLSAIVLRWSRARKRYERQGALVEEEALRKAEEECLSDADLRERRREREALRRLDLDQKYIQEFASRIRNLFPKMPKDRELKIAEHACQKYSGRVGRSADAKSFDEQAIKLAVRAHVRHAETDYDALLGRGWDRSEARDHVSFQVEKILAAWALL